MISSAFLQLPDAPESPLPFHDAPKTRKSKPVNGKPQTMPTFPATTECHFTKPNTKSTTVQIERRARGLTVHLTALMLHSPPLLTSKGVGTPCLGSLRFWIVVGLYIAVHIGIDRTKKGLMSTKKLADSASVFVVDQVLQHQHDYPVGMVFYAGQV
jgi:hypothetical protein